MNFLYFSGRQSNLEQIAAQGEQKEFFQAMKRLAENYELRKVIVYPL